MFTGITLFIAFIALVAVKVEDYKWLVVGQLAKALVISAVVDFCAMVLIQLAL